MARIVGGIGASHSPTIGFAKVTRVHRTSYLPSMANIATVIYEDLGAALAQKDVEAYRKHMAHALAGGDKARELGKR